MSIKSVRNNIDLASITNKKQHAPNYIAKSKDKVFSAKGGQIDTMSDYVKENLTKIVKPRYGESR